MANFITRSNFVLDINLTDKQLISITPWIEEYEKDILVKLLGIKLYNLLQADLVNGVPQAQIYKDLVNGVDSFEFQTVDGYEVTVEYKGLKNLIAYYVYFVYRNQTEVKTTTVGQKRPMAENSEKEDVLPKLIHAWNKCRELYGNTPNCYRLHDRNYFLDQNNYEHWTPYGDAFNFLLANKDSYPDWVFEPMGKLDIYGIGL